MWVTARKYADGCGVHIKTVQRWCRIGTLDARRVSGRWYVKEDEPPQEEAATAQESTKK